MEFYSTRHISPAVSFKEAVLDSLPPDHGLYMPEYLHSYPRDFLAKLSETDFAAHSFITAKSLLGDSMPDDILAQIIEETLSFPCPLLKLENGLSVLELTHGPSLAFKDYGARFMARVMRYYKQNHSRELNVLVATSGDTGGAVALGFLGVEGIKVHILFPSGKISKGQEKQLTTLGQNIIAYEIEGSFDHCQAIVKKAFLDPLLNEKKWLTSANSINIARLIPQTFYYTEAYKQAGEDKPIIFCTPSGNFGNLTAGLFAKKCGLPVAHFIAANNLNNPVCRYLDTGKYDPMPAVSTLSNAMDVGAPSNFVRMLTLYNNELDLIRKDISGYTIDEPETEQAMKTLWQKYNYLACPHTALAYKAVMKYRVQHPEVEAHFIFLSTAHPSKFEDSVMHITGQQPAYPPQLKELMQREGTSIKSSASYEDFREKLLQVT